MQCPNCKHDLKKREYNKIELDHCVNCEGMWFDDGEFKKVKDAQDDILRWLDVDLFSDVNKFSGGYTTMACPNGHEPLYEIFYNSGDIKVDVCKTCHGMWLDRNEYENIIALLKRTVFREDAGAYMHHLGEEIKEVLSGSEGISTELQDVYMVFHLLENRIVSQWPKIEEIIVALRTAILK